jgi:hypothetical protein
MPLPRSRPLSPTEQGNQMLNHDTVREATRLTRAGQLIEATALMQRMLRGESTPESSGTTLPAAPARLEPPTIELEANVVEERESPQTTQSSSATPRRKSPAPFDSMKDFSGLRLRGSIRRAPPSTPDIAPKAGRFIEGTLRSGKPDLQAIHPKPLSGTTASSDRHASRLHPVTGRFRGRHKDEFPGGRAELLRCLP